MLLFLAVGIKDKIFLCSHYLNLEGQNSKPIKIIEILSENLYEVIVYEVNCNHPFFNDMDSDYILN